MPEHVREADFEYLQSKVPALDSLLSDHIELSTDSIYNLCKDDRTQKLISEYVGVGIGLKYSTLLLNTTPNKFKRINRAVKGKYLDYSTISLEKKYEIETKGTVGRYYSEMKKDVLNKKANQKGANVHLRFGTISMLKKDKTLIKSKSQCVIVDDPPIEVPEEEDDTFMTQLYSYAGFLSHILDSKYYNKFIKRLRSTRSARLAVPGGRFFGRYNFEKRKYFGEFFDHRHIVKEFLPLAGNNTTLGTLFEAVTRKLGRKKLFIGIEESLIKAINLKDQNYLNLYALQPRFIVEKGVTRFLDRDGILIVKSVGGHDKQINQLFPEKEVERRLGLFLSYIRQQAHRCGAPCTSPGIEGKPCEKLTYRDRCFFHR